MDRYAGPAAGFPRGVTPAVTSPFIIVTLSYRGVRLWAIQLFPEAPAEPTACRCVMNEDGGALVPGQGSSSIAQRPRRLQIARGLQCILYHTFLLIAALLRPAFFQSVVVCFLVVFFYNKTLHDMIGCPLLLQQLSLKA